MKTYIKPESHVVEVRLIGSILQGAYTLNTGTKGTDISASRQQYDKVWDEEEEENTGGWFQ